MTGTRTITVTLTFDEESLNEILKEAHFGDGEPPKVADLSDEQFKRLTEEITKTNFVTEIVEGSGDACANDWLSDFMEQFSN